MADQLKEIHNADVYLSSFTGASKSIITTDGTTQYVIKDVQVGTNTIPGTEVLSVNGVTVSPALTSNLTGSEIVDVSSAVSIVLPSAPAYTKSTVASFSNGYNAGSVYGDLSSYTASIGTNSSTTTVGTYSPAIASTFSSVGGRTTTDYWFVNGDFYYWTYNGNDGWAFYKRAGGVNGTETLLKDSSNGGSITQNPGNYGWVLYDATANRFYLYGSNNIVVTYNPTTNTSTSVSVSGISTPSSYMRATLSNNGLICVIPVFNNASQVFAINPATGFYILFASLYNWYDLCIGSSQDIKLFVHFTGTQYHILRTPSISSSTWTRTITNASSPPTFPTSSSSTYTNYVTNISTSLTFGGDIVSTIGGAYLPETYGPNNATYSYVLTPSSTAPVIRTFDLVNFSLSSTTLSNVSILSGRGFKLNSPAVAATSGEIASNTNFPQRIRLRITGVQTTL